jgi:transcriptional regulator with XRE-family HTH domain
VDAADEFLTIQRRLAANVAAFRATRRWSQQRAADASGIDLKHWQKIEYGQLNPTLRTLSAVAGAFGVSVAKLLGGPPRAKLERRPVGRPRTRSRGRAAQ